MITKVVTDYLEDENVSDNKKYMLLANLNLNYSDLFYLMSLYKNEEKIYRIVNALCIFENSKLKQKIKKQNRDNNRTYVYKRMKKVRRQKSYD